MSIIEFCTFDKFFVTEPLTSTSTVWHFPSEQENHTSPGAYVSRTYRTHSDFQNSDADVKKPDGILIAVVQNRFEMSASDRQRRAGSGYCHEYLILWFR